MILEAFSLRKQAEELQMDTEVVSGGSLYEC